MAYVAPTVRSVGDAVTAADYNIMANDVLDHETRIAALPRGVVASTTLATTFATASTSAVDVTGFSVTFTAVAGRQYKISVFANIGSNVSAVCLFYIVTGATGLAEGYLQPSAGIGALSMHTLHTPGAGSVTYKIQTNTASGTLTMYGTSTRASIASRMIVEDIGAA